MYNRALDKIAAAVLAFRAGKMETASAAFLSACTDPTMRAAIMAIERTNAKGFKAQASKAAMRLKASEEDMAKEDEVEVEDDAAEKEEALLQARRIRARKLRRAALASDDAGVPMDEVGDDFRIEPEVESADFDDLDGPLDEDGGELDMAAETEDLDLDEEIAPELNQAARFKRAMANMLVAAKKKPMAKKKPVAKRK